MTGDDDRELLRRMAEAADELTRPAWRTPDLEVEYKDDGSPVTPVDRAVEEALLALVSDAGHADGFLGEEVGAHPGSSGRTWVVDGIDGTGNFVAGRPNWSTLIALVVDGVPVVGAATSPALGRRWSTSASGVVLEERPTPTDDGAGAGASGDATGGRLEVTATLELSVSSTDELDGARIAVWPPDVEAVQRLGEGYPALFQLVGTPRSSSQLVGEKLSHGAIPVVDGRLDAMVAFSGGAWDHAGPAALVRAAGGRFTAIDGSPALDTRTGVYSNGRIHDRLLDLLHP
ncbi:MAG: inositol monophosphatase family protein [Actinomycetota bacterium]